MRKAFTLIELLIVVAIIAILAAIAVPNFLEAQTRAKVSRVKADLRSMATCMEAYAVDANCIPNCHSTGLPMRDPAEAAGVPILERLSTPIAYISNAIVKDVFKIRGRFAQATASAMAAAPDATLVPPGDLIAANNCFVYQAWNSSHRYPIPPDGFVVAGAPTKSVAWLLHSAGPSSNYYNLGGVLANDGADQLPFTIQLIYDPTNGSVSRGAIFRIGGQVGGGGTGYKAGQGLALAIYTQK